MRNSLSRLFYRLKLASGLNRTSLQILSALSIAILALLLINMVLYVIHESAANAQNRDVSNFVSPLLELFNVGNEYNVPSWFSAALWAQSAALAFVIAAHSIRRAAWILFGAVCVYLSLDETMSIHEMLGRVSIDMFGAQGGILNFEWVILGVFLALGLVAAALRAVLSLTRSIRNTVIFSGIVFLTGALLFEGLSGWALEVNGYYLIYHSLMWFEEGFEMLGVAILIAALVTESRLHVRKSAAKNHIRRMYSA